MQLLGPIKSVNAIVARGGRAGVDFVATIFFAEPSISWLTFSGCHKPIAGAPGVAAGGRRGRPARSACGAGRCGDASPASGGSAGRPLPAGGARDGSAIPLEPAARVVGVDPAFAAPDRERLAGI